MNRSQPLPGDRPEIELAVTGVASSRVRLPVGISLQAGGVRLVPTLPAIKFDSRGRGVLLVVAARVGSTVANGTAATPTLPVAGVTFGVVTNTDRTARIGHFARELALAIGPSLQPTDRSRAAQQLEGQGYAVSLGYDTVQRARKQLHPHTADELLSAWELRLGLVPSPGLDITLRQSLALAAFRGAFAGSEERLLSALHAIDTTIGIRNGRQAECTASKKRIYVFNIITSVANWNDPLKNAAISKITRRQAPAHALFNLVTRVGFRLDDPDSLLDRDSFGA